MSKQLILDFMPFKPIGSLNESNGADFGIPGGFVVNGILQRHVCASRTSRTTR